MRDGKPIDHDTIEMARLDQRQESSSTSSSSEDELPDFLKRVWVPVTVAPPIPIEA